jgi:hypothetical protein
VTHLALAHSKLPVGIMSEQHELSRISAPRAPARTMRENDDDEQHNTTSRLHKRTLLKLDTLLLPFLALLFLFNSLDKSNVSSVPPPSDQPF